MNCLRCATVLLSSLPLLPAQASTGATGGKPEVSAAKPAEVDPRVQRMRDQIRDGKDIRSHVRVTVRLENGNRMHGIVKDIKLVERIDGVRFAKADATDVGAGIRLWYSDGRNNYVFLPFTSIRDYKVQEKLSSIQLKEIEDKMAVAQAVAPAAPGASPGEAPPLPGEPVPPPADAATAGAEARPGDAVPGATPVATTGTSTAPQGGLDEAQKKQFALLQEYPPAAGWTQARRDEIARRKAVVGSTPTAAEQRFVDHFAEWQKACAVFGVEPAAEPVTTTEAEAESGKRSRRKKD